MTDTLGCGGFQSSTVEKQARRTIPGGGSSTMGCRRAQSELGRHLTGRGNGLLKLRNTGLHQGFITGVTQRQADVRTVRRCCIATITHRGAPGRLRPPPPPQAAHLPLTLQFQSPFQSFKSKRVPLSSSRPTLPAGAGINKCRRTCNGCFTWLESDKYLKGKQRVMRARDPGASVNRLTATPGRRGAEPPAADVHVNPFGQQQK